MLIQTESGKQGEMFHLPFVLRKTAGYPHILTEVAVIPRHYVVKGVVAILQSSRKRGGSKKAVVHVSHIHRPAHCRKVFGLSVSIGVFTCAVITVAVDVLRRTIHRQFVAIFAEEHIIRQSAAVYNVFRLLGNVCFVRLKVELVTSAPEFVRGMILDADAAELCGAVVSTKPEGIHVQFTQFRETVAVGIVRIAVAVRLVEGDAIRIIRRHQRGIGTHVLLPHLSVEVRHGRRYLKRIVHRVFGDDVDGSAHGICPEQRRAAATHHLYALNHVGRNLLQSVHARQRTHHRTAVYQNLRIRTFQSVDAHLRESAILAVVFHTQSRLKVKRLGEVVRVDYLKQAVVHHVYHHRSQLSVGLVAVGRHHHLVGHNRFFFHHKVHVNSEIIAHRYALGLGRIPHALYLQRIFSCRNILKAEVAFGIGSHPYARFNYQYISVWQTFLRIFFYHMSGNNVSLFHRINRHAYKSAQQSRQY